MNTKIVTISLALAVILSVIIHIEFFPFGLKKVENLPNTSINYYKADIKIRDKNDFINFLKDNTQDYELGSFMNPTYEVEWDKVSEAIDVYRKLWRKVYSIEYKTLDPECNKQSLAMTSNGYIKDYRSSGK